MRKSSSGGEHGKEIMRSGRVYEDYIGRRRGNLKNMDLCRSLMITMISDVKDPADKSIAKRRRRLKGSTLSAAAPQEFLAYCVKPSGAINLDLSFR